MIKTVVNAHRTVTEQCNVVHVAPESVNVLVDPLESHELIHQAEIAGTEIVVEREPAEDAGAVLNGDDDDAFSR